MRPSRDIQELVTRNVFQETIALLSACLRANAFWASTVALSALEIIDILGLLGAAAPTLLPTTADPATFAGAVRAYTLKSTFFFTNGLGRFSSSPRSQIGAVRVVDEGAPEVSALNCWWLDEEGARGIIDAVD